MSLRTCVEWATESFSECNEWEDQGSNACDDWDDQCCTWWPCSWACEVVTWVCVAWVWVTNLVCIGWTLITTTTCIAWEIVSVIMTPIAWITEWILAIPIIGRILDEIRDAITSLLQRLLKLPDLLLGLIGVRPLKRVRLCVIILRDEAGIPTATPASIQPAIDEAVAILRAQSNIAVIVEGVVTVDGPSPTDALDVGCNLQAWGEDLWLAGSYFQAMGALHFPTGAFGRLTGNANPIMAFCVRTIDGGGPGTIGCALWPNDYLTIEGGSPQCLAHEMGHKMGLTHCCAGTNLANGVCGGTQLAWWQTLIVRNSEYCTYF